MADRILSPDDRADLAKEFARIEAEEIGESVHEKYHRMAHELTA
jgi:hemerythrin-like domain-containing protein